MRIKVVALMAVAAFLTANIGSVQAQDRRDHWDRRHDIHHFRDHDFARWRGGRWFHGPHGGRDGWWWIVGGVWYFYPARIDPYPDPYVPPAIVATPAPPRSTTYYYCDNPAGYYPYVASCQTPWRAVTTTP